MRFRSVLACAFVALSTTSVLASCGNDDDGVSDSTAAVTETTAATETTAGNTATTAETYTVVPDADVAKALPEVIGLADSAAGKVEAGAKDDAASDIEQMYDKWFAVEGTVRARDTDQYLDIEDALTLVKLGAEQGDGAKARSGADSVKKLMDAYLVTFPGDGSEPPLTVDTKPVEHKVAAQLGDFEITMPTPVPGGVVEFELKNTGKETHEFLVLRTDLTADKLPTDAEGNVDEKGAGVTLVDEREDIEAGKAAELVIDLEPGKYVFLCNVPGHYVKKMYLGVTVS